MPSVVAEIKQWAKQLPYWEQSALDKTLAGQKFTGVKTMMNSCNISSKMLA